MQKDEKQLLIEQCRKLERESYSFLMPHNVLNWWTKYKKTERKELRDKAMSKLTPEEKEALGLDHYPF